MTEYFGENKCNSYYKNGNLCKNMAYYKQDNKLLCGMHSSISKRIMLPKNPNFIQNMIKLYNDRKQIVESIAEENRKMNRKGNIICTKLQMMKQPKHIDGYLKIFPNYKHQFRKDGFGCSSLSPKSLGPIDHKMKDLPIAKNLENYHQGSKIFIGEIENNIIKKESIDIRKKIYNSDIPYRHKFSQPDAKKIITNIDKNKNIPLFSIYYDKNGNECRYNYIESRYFYCHFYEILAQQTDDYKKLKYLLENGYNLQIIGYDGYEINKNIMDHYLDNSKPFGHEIVLYCLLTIENSKNYPWNKYYEEHKDIYKNIL